MKCFVLMPFSQEYLDTYNKCIKPAVTSQGYECSRADDPLAPRNIISDIIQEIFSADIIIADISGANANVFYELGIAHTIANKTIIIKELDGKEIPFDLGNYRIIHYAKNTESEQQKFIAVLIRAIKDLDKWSLTSTNPVQDFRPIKYSIPLQHQYQLEGRIDVLEKELSEISKAAEAPQLYIKHKAPNELQIELAINKAKKSLTFQGISLMSLVNGRNTNLLVNKLTASEFEHISMIIAHPANIQKGSKVQGEILHFLEYNQVGILLRAGEKMGCRIKLYISKEFVRYSATYVDEGTPYGIIRVAFPMFGLILQESPITLISHKKNPDVYNCFYNSLIKFRERIGKPIISVDKLREFRESMFDID